MQWPNYPSVRPETAAAIRAAELAIRLAKSRKGADRVTSKGGIDLVTATDLACEDAIRDELSRAFPAYTVVGEERGGVPDPGRPYWLVDPICGTRSFASDLPLYCTNIALVENGAVTAAAIGVGVTEEVLYAEEGSGAWMRTSSGEQRISVGEDSNSIWIDPATEHGADVIRRAALSKRWYVWAFPSTVCYAYLAAGRISGILHFRRPSKSPYGSVHTAAGCFVASEAGALVMDLETGRAWDLNTRSLLLASSAAVHHELKALAGTDHP